MSGSGALPSRGSRVSLAAPKPAFRINTATSRPSQPSNWSFVKWVMTRPSSTTAVARASDRESAAVAAKALDWMRFPSAPLNHPIHSFTATAQARMPAVRAVSSVSSG